MRRALAILVASILIMPLSIVADENQMQEVSYREGNLIVFLDLPVSLTRKDTPSTGLAVDVTWENADIANYSVMLVIMDLWDSYKEVAPTRASVNDSEEILELYVANMKSSMSNSENVSDPVYVKHGGSLYGKYTVDSEVMNIHAKTHVYLTIRDAMMCMFLINVFDSPFAPKSDILDVPSFIMDSTYFYMLDFRQW